MQYVPELTWILFLRILDEKLPTRADSEHSWTVTHEAIVTKGYDLKAVNSHAPDISDKRTPTQLLAEITKASQDLEAALAHLQTL